MSANREHKNSVFTTLFDNTDNLLSLYNAVSGSDLPADTPIKIATLKNVLFNDLRNDIAFVLGDKLVILVEHQSTINENMPLRMLIYLTRVYEKLIDKKAIYKRKLLRIPKPDFIVLYNGTDPFPDEKMLYLSDAYKEYPEKAEGLGGSLDLSVRVLNINIGRNDEIVMKSESLYGYVRFIGKIRNNLQTGIDLAGAITKAVSDCLKEGILSDFLKTHATEVINMLTTKWNDEQARKVWEEEAREEGLDLSAEIVRALLKNESIEDIAARFHVSIDKVKQLQSVLIQPSA